MITLYILKYSYYSKMRKYNYNLEGRERICGLVTGDRDVAINRFCGEEYIGEKTHKHTQSDEIILTTRGIGTIWIEGQIYGLKPGEAIRIERGELHRVLSVSAPSKHGPLELLAIQVPSIDDKIVEEPEELTKLINS